MAKHRKDKKAAPKAKPQAHAGRKAKYARYRAAHPEMVPKKRHRKLHARSGLIDGHTGQLLVEARDRLWDN